MNELSLFSGVGGGLLGSKLLGWRCIGYVENDKYCQEVIRQRMADGVLDIAPQFGDIRKFISEGYAETYKGMVDIITAGFPCTPWSIAGTRLGKKHKDNFWPQTIRCVEIVKPKAVLLENSPRLFVQPYLGQIFNDLEKNGYEIGRPILIGADVFGASIHRKRLWILACTSGFGQAWLQNAWHSWEDKTADEVKPFNLFGWPPGPRAQSDIPRSTHGMAGKLDRVESIGNGQVPLCMAYAFSVLSQGIA